MLRFFGSVPLLFLLAAGCSRRPTQHLEVSGTIEMTEAYLSAAVPGRVATLTVRDGDTVKAGDRLATLDHFEDAQRDFERARTLVVSGGSTQQQLDKAKLALQDQQLVAPFDAIVIQRVSEPGEVVSPGVPVVILGNPRDIWMRVFVTEVDAGRLRVGDVACVHIDAFPNRSFEGKVIYISPKAEFTPKNIQTKEERVTQMFAVKIALPSSDGILKPGLPADAQINVRPSS